MFEGNSADTCGGSVVLMLVGDRAEGLACVFLAVVDGFPKRCYTLVENQVYLL